MGRHNKRKVNKMPQPDIAVLRRIWVKMGTPKECWPWLGSLNTDGYPTCMPVAQSRKRLGKVFYPHRLMFHWFKHPLPNDLTIDHLCKNRRCLNPDHMEAVTIAENVGRAVKRAYCKRGHPQTAKNRYTAPGSGQTRCKPCIKVRNKVTRSNKRAKMHKRSIR